MKRLLLLLLFSVAFNSLSQAQRVETLIKGPSSFDDGLAVDDSGYIYASRYYGNTITKISPEGETSIFSSGFGSPNAIAFDHKGNLLVPSATGNKVHRISQDGSKEIIVSYLKNPTGVVVDSVGNILISQYSLSKIVKLDTAGNITPFLSGGLLNGPVSMIYDDEGDLFIGNFNDGRVLKYSSDSTLSVVGDVSGWLGSFTLVDSTIYMSGLQRNRIYKVSKNGGDQTTFAGTGTSGNKDGTLNEATFNGPNGIAASNTGDTLYISDFESRSLRMITGLIPNNPKIKIDTEVSFGEVSINTIAVDSILVENVGNDTLVITDFVSSSNVFTIEVDSIKIPAYSSEIIAISFHPDNAGSFNSVISFNTNSNENLIELTVSGEGISSTSNESDDEKVGGFRLTQNYPNPFNPTTRIAFTLGKAGYTELTVYDINGKQVASLLSRFMASGDHEVNFDARNLTSGTYIARLKSNDRVTSIKLTLLK